MGIHSEPRLYHKMVEFLKLLNIYMLRLIKTAPNFIKIPKTYRKIQKEMP